jgi:hypothetical protein
MNPKQKFLIVVGIALFVTFHMVLLFVPIIPVEETYVPDIAVVDIDGDGTLDIVRPPSGGLTVADIDGDGDLEIVMPFRTHDYNLQDYLSTRTVYKSIVELLLG